MYVCMYVFMYACMYVRMYICMYYVCTHVCMYAYMYITIYSTFGSAFFVCVCFPHCSCCDRLVTSRTTFQMKTAQFYRISGEDREITTS